MKKMFVFAIAALSLVGQMNLAHAGGARDMKSAESRARETDKRAREAGDANGAGAHSAAAVEIGRKVDGLKIGNLSSEQARSLKAAAATDEAVRTALDEIVAQQSDASLNDFNAARLEGLANMKGIPRDVNAQALAQLDPSSRASQSYLTMVLNASGKAATWAGGETGARTMFGKILADANSQIRSGKSTGEALTEAVRAHLKAQKGTEPTAKDIENFIDSITKYCK
jgi:hypothetical protein